MEATLTQTWTPIPGYEGYYVTNTLGEVKRVSRAQVQQKKLEDTKVLSTRINNSGYQEVRLSKEGKTSTTFIHKLIALTFIENTENKPEVNHKNGIKVDNQISNLEWVTHSENMKHAYANNLLKQVSKCVVDKCSDREFDSVKEAAICFRIKYNTLKNYLNGSNKNPTCLEYKQAV